MKLTGILVAASLACALLAVTGTASAADPVPSCVDGVACQNIEGCLESGASPLTLSTGARLSLLCPL